MTNSTGTTIWIDGDSAPRACKDVVFKACRRLGITVVMVANRFQVVPELTALRFVRVGGGPDVADDHIAENCRRGDLVITADIPLAARVIEVGATVICFRGESLTEENVGERLAVRDFMDDLRGAGVMTDGPAAYGPKDKQRFANALDRWSTQNR